MHNRQQHRPYLALAAQWRGQPDTLGRTPADGALYAYHESLYAAALLVDCLPGTQVLDFGIGTGAFAALFAARGADICGVDISAEMIDECLAVYPDFHVVVGSFTPIPYDDAQFDLLISSFALHEIMPISRGAACREFARVTRPYGHICLLDTFFVSSAARQEARYLSRGMWDNNPADCLLHEMDDLLRDAGFGQIWWQQTGLYHWAVVGRRNG